MLNPSTDYIPTAADLMEFEGDEARIKAFSETRKRKKRVPNDGRSFHELYSTWYNMIQRCTNPRAINWSDYGAKGVTVCKRWCDPLTGFAAFCEDMGPRPQGYSLDRIAVDGPYSKQNCRWADLKTQNQNRSNTRWITCPVTYRTMCLQDWAREVGLFNTVLARRLEAGWEITDALYTPVDTEKEQARRQKKLLCPDGIARGLREAARHYGLNHQTLRNRLGAGMSPHDALTMPPLSRQECGRRAGEAHKARAQAKEAQAASCPSS